MAHIFIDYFKKCGIKTGSAADQLHAGRFVDECVKELDLFGDENKEPCVECGFISEIIAFCPNGCDE
jgi:hypothetical protein